MIFGRKCIMIFKPIISFANKYIVPNTEKAKLLTDIGKNVLIFV